MHGPAVRLNDFGDKGKSETGTLDCLDRGRPVELVEDPVEVGFENARAAIAYGDSVAIDRDVDRRVGRAELDGIGQHIRYRPFQMGALAIN